MGEGFGEVLQLTDNDADDREPEGLFDPDGEVLLIAFASNLDGDYEIYVMPYTEEGAGELEQLTDNDANDTEPLWVWGGEGGGIIWASNLDGDYEIYAMGEGFGEVLQLTDNDADDREPWWPVEPSAEEIAFASNRDLVCPPPVGGELYPVNKLSILAPWLTLAVLLAVGGGFMIIRRRQAV